MEGSYKMPDYVPRQRVLAIQDLRRGEFDELIAVKGTVHIVEVITCTHLGWLASIALGDFPASWFVAAPVVTTGVTMGEAGARQAFNMPPFKPGDSVVVRRGVTAPTWCTLDSTGGVFIVKLCQLSVTPKQNPGYIVQFTTSNDACFDASLFELCTFRTAETVPEDTPVVPATTVETKAAEDVRRQYKCFTTHSQPAFLEKATKLGPQAVHTVAVVLNQSHHAEFYLFYWE